MHAHKEVTIKGYVDRVAQTAGRDVIEAGDITAASDEGTAADEGAAARGTG